MSFEILWNAFLVPVTLGLARKHCIHRIVWRCISRLPMSQNMYSKELGKYSSLSRLELCCDSRLQNDEY